MYEKCLSTLTFRTTLAPTGFTPHQIETGNGAVLIFVNPYVTGPGRETA
ncbi:hypothetical protein LCGC14_0098110 [marine sediment metagenome]|uniref:Uncharacterized protein n=1 Tax=marine sediment metagenome TaxID=412755 RepID=A0A0F9VU04_9ZZZZ